MNNLHNGLSKVLSTITQVAKAYEDKKIIWSEWLKIGATVIGWIWLFKHLTEIKADIDTATEQSMSAMMEQIKVEFDIPQDALEETIEQALSIILTILTMVGKTVEMLALNNVIPKNKAA